MTANVGSAHPASASAGRGLIYTSDSLPGIRRHRRGKGFVYRDAKGKPVRQEKTLARIRSLAIPPAYNDVWICADARGHLQATGRDAKGRKQYRYHPRWRQLRDRGKFSHITEFGSALPRLRRRARRDLTLPGMPQDKVLALLVRLLDETLIRIGNEAYASENGSYGLTTLRNRHIRFEPGRLYFSFRAKSGKPSRIALDNQRLTRLVRRLHQLPGQRLFQYVDELGAHRPIDSDMVNQYIHEASGGDFTAKDFRTWKGTTAALALLACTRRSKTADDHAVRAQIADVVQKVSALLRNTPAVCRASYIHPAAFTGWLDGSLQKAVSRTTARNPRQLERAALRFLQRHKAAR
ncbi:MAG TPA: DNA topoisomerase IB [Dyella sp.]